MVFRLLAALLIVGAAALAVPVWRDGRLLLEAGGHAFFITSPWEIGGLCLGALLLLAAASRRASRWGRASLLAAAAAGFAVLLAADLFQTQPAKAAALETADRAPGHRRTLIVGIDALSWDRLLPLVRQQRLPNFARLMREGSYGVLHSHRTLRPSVQKEGYWSPVVWTTIATGVTVDKHGIDDFSIRQDDRTAKLAGTWHRKSPAFWNLFSAFDRSVGIVGWWGSWPAEEVNGILVSSSVGLRGHRGIRHIDLEDDAWFRKRRRLTFPEQFKHVIAGEIGLPRDTDRFMNERIFPLDRYPLRDGSERETLRSVLWQDRLYLDITLHLLEKEKFDLYATYFEGIDALSHQFWGFIDHPDEIYRQARFHVPGGFEDHTLAVDRYYEVVDGYLGQLLAAAGDETTVIVCSDHGFRTEVDHPRKADHSGYGALLVKGAGIRAETNLNLSLRGSLFSLIHGPVTVLDVLPTLLYMHDLPISEELDGRVLYRVFEPAYLHRHREIRVPTYGDFEATREIEIPSEDEEEYLERMRSLGYVG